jgi:hypothetical protein
MQRLQTDQTRGDAEALRWGRLHLSAAVGDIEPTRRHPRWLTPPDISLGR